MERFATNKNGNIDSGTEVLANNMVYLQQAKANAISNLFGDLFVEGILNTGNVDTMFKLSANNDGTFNVSIGIAYKKDVTTGLFERIAILEPSIYHNEPYGDSTYPDGRGVNQKTFDGVNSYVNTPKSTGCVQIPIPNPNVIYYVDLRYLNVCDNGNDGTGTGLTNYSIAKNEIIGSTNKRKRFYKWTNGYEIVLISNITYKQGIILGTVERSSSNVITITDTGRTDDLLINSNVFMNYFIEGSGITIIEEDGKKMLSVNVDNITTEIANNKVRVTKDGLYPYTKFTVNSGHTNNDNEPDVLLTDTVGITINFGVGTQIPLIVSPAYNDKYTILPTDTITNISSVRDYINTTYGETEGTYTVCVNNTNKDTGDLLENSILELMKKVYISKTAPSTIKGDIWIDISSEPFKAKWFNGGSWVDYHGVPLGETVVTSETITVSSFNFAKRIEDEINLKRCNLYNYNSTSEKAEISLTDNNYIKINNIEGFSFDNEGEITIDRENNILDLTSFSAVNINGNPIIRMPNFAGQVGVISHTSYSSPEGWTATNDGWVNCFVGSSGNITQSTVKINNATIISMRGNAHDTETSTYTGLFPIKKGDYMEVLGYVQVYFYPNR